MCLCRMFRSISLLHQFMLRYLSFLACCSSSWCDGISAAICPAQMRPTPVSPALSFHTLDLLFLIDLQFIFGESCDPWRHGGRG